MTSPALPFSYTDLNTIFAAQPDVASIDAVQIEEAAGEAEAEINGYLARLYVLPLAPPVPPLLTTLATNIAIYKVYTAVTFSRPQRDVETAWAERYRAAIAILLKLASGEMLLIGADGILIPTLAETAGVAWSNTMRYHPTFGEGNVDGFFVDRNKLEDEASRRQ
jgi:phage gp36-like protein